LSQLDISPELNIKVKKNLLKVFFITVIMLFAGLTSAYLVYRGSAFWVHITLPEAFVMSTIFIVLSSAFLMLASYALKNGKNSLLKLSLGLAMLGGVFFGYYQFKGFNQLIDSGNKLVGPIIENSGRYGNIFSMTYQGKSLSFDNDQFYLKGEELSGDLHAKLNDFGQALTEKAKRGENFFELEDYGSGFMLFYDINPMTYSENKLYVDAQPLTGKQLREVYEFGENLANDRGDFIMQGKYGEDFTILYGGTPLEYKNRTFYMDGKELSPKLKNDLNGAINTSSSFIYVFTGLHLLHWIGGVIALLVVFIKGLQNKYTKADYLGITLGSNYWHFLGILWLYLYAFLIFIH
jgi:cytochrome c oxidase subunit III